MSVAVFMHSSVFSSPSRFLQNEVIITAADIWRIGLYLSSAQRAMHSLNSSNSSVVIASVSLAWPTDSWSSDCDEMNANLACGSESEILNLLRQRSSPVISESW